MVGWLHLGMQEINRTDFYWEKKPWSFAENKLKLSNPKMNYLNLIISFKNFFFFSKLAKYFVLPLSSWCTSLWRLFPNTHFLALLTQDRIYHHMKSKSKQSDETNCKCFDCPWTHFSLEMLKNSGYLSQVGGENEPVSPMMLQFALDQKAWPQTLASDQLFDLVLTHLKYSILSCRDI